MAINKIPTGWALCDGRILGGVCTPNLSGRFIVGYKAGHSEYDQICNTGGQASVTLSMNQMPPHSHNYNTYTFQDRGDRSGAFSHSSNIVTNWTSYSTNSVGRGESHENRPPFFVLAYIIKL